MGSKPGRKLLLEYNDRILANIVKALKLGNTRRVAALYGNISPETFTHWMKRGREDPNAPECFREFVTAVEWAESEAERRDIDIIDKAAAGRKTLTTRTKTVSRMVQVQGPDGKFLFDDQGEPIFKTVDDVETVVVEGSVFDWRAAAWRRERRNSKEWGVTTKLEHTGEAGGPIVAQIIRVPQKAESAEAWSKRQTTD